MFEETQRFYQLTEVHEVPEAAPGEAPITHTQVFYKEYPRFEAIELPETDFPAVSLEDAYLQRVSVRDFAEQPLAWEEVAAVLNSCRIVDPERDPERRTYPSAGARFPIETYLLALRVEGFDPGCYHFKPRTHELEVLWPAELSSREAEIVSPFVSHPAAAIVMTSVISRAEIKYGYKAYPFSLIETGHMAQNMLLTCAALGIGACPVGGFVNDTLTSLLDLTEDELPLYVLALGRPRGPESPSAGG